MISKSFINCNAAVQHCNIPSENPYLELALVFVVLSIHVVFLRITCETKSVEELLIAAGRCFLLTRSDSWVLKLIYLLVVFVVVWVAMTRLVPLLVSQFSILINSFEHTVRSSALSVNKNTQCQTAQLVTESLTFL